MLAHAKGINTTQNKNRPGTRKNLLLRENGVIHQPSLFPAKISGVWVSLSHR